MSTKFSKLLQPRKKHLEKSVVRNAKICGFQFEKFASFLYNWNLVDQSDFISVC